MIFCILLALVCQAELIAFLALTHIDVWVMEFLNDALQPCTVCPTSFSYICKQEAICVPLCDSKEKITAEYSHIIL